MLLDRIFPSVPRSPDGDGAEAPPPAIATAEVLVAEPAVEAPIAAVEAPVEPADKTPSWVQPRINTLSAQRAAAEEALRVERANGETLRAQITALQEGKVPALPPGAKVYTESEVQALATRKAQEFTFADQIKDLGNKGRAKFTDFDSAITNITNAIGPIPDVLLEAVVESGAGPEVLYALSKDLNKATEIVLAGSPAKIAAQVVRYADALKTPTKLAASNAPSPIVPKIAGAGAPTTSLENASMAEFARIRNEQANAKRRRA